MNLFASVDPLFLDTLEQTQSLPSTPGDFGTAFLKMILTLIALVILLFATYWFLKRLIQNRNQKGGRSQLIQIIEKRMLSPKTTLYLVEIEGKKVLIAESHLEVRRLESWTDLSPDT